MDMANAIESFEISFMSVPTDETKLPRKPRSIVDMANTLDTSPIDAEARMRRFRERHPDVVAYFDAVSRLPESRLDALASALVNYTPGQGMAAARLADRETRLIERVWHRRPGSVDRARRLWHFWRRTIPGEVR